MPLSEDSAMRTQAEDALHNSEERIRLILDSTNEAICGCDSEGTCLFSNPSAARMLGYGDPAELLGKNIHALQHHTRKDGTPYPLEECPIYIGFQKGESVHRDDEVFWRRDGTSFPVEYWSHPVVRECRTLGAVITFIDITDQKQAEAALRKSERELRTIIETIPAFVVSALPDGSVDFLSQSLLDYTGLSREQWLGWGWRDIAHPEDGERAVNKWRVALAGGEPLEVEVRYRRADGKYRWYLGRQVPLRDDKGNIVKWYGTLHDIEDQKQAEAALRKSEEQNRILLQINNAIITNLTQQALLHSISEALHPVFPFDRCAITLYQPERDSFYFLAVEGELLSDYFKTGLELSRNETCGSWAFEHLRPLVRRRVENPSRRNVGGLRIGLFNPIAEALEFPDHSGGAVSL
jgi:PAS domain S-box-containing protein